MTDEFVKCLVGSMSLDVTKKDILYIGREHQIVANGFLGITFYFKLEQS